MFSYLVAFVVAATVTAMASYLVLRVSRRFGLAPAVRARDVHSTPTPRLGGIAMLIGLLVAFLIAGTQPEFATIFASSAQVWALLGACGIVAVVGILDDLLDLDWMIKLAAQLAATGLLAWNGVQILSLPFGDTLIVGSPALNFVLTVFLMTLVMNAVNFVDGLDGLVAGVAIIANSLFFIYTRLLAEQQGRVDSVTFASLIAIIVVGICAGFLPFNWHRAKMFMGDTGALLVGLLMATSTVSVTGQLNPATLDQKLVLAAYIPIILPIAVLALPLADFSLAVIRRLKAGKSPFAADRLHLHHRLLYMGHSPLQAVLIFYLGTAVLSVAVLLVFTTQDFLWPVIVLVVGGAATLLMLLFPAERVRDAAAQRGLITLKSKTPTKQLAAVPTQGPATERTPSDYSRTARTERFGGAGSRPHPDAGIAADADDCAALGHHRDRRTYRGIRRNRVARI
ncbi:undecaprenyl/decaprenyl-phosphate alpha-N-acetylglucosaminyl 1-phosphate transferase [Leucobacter insecticola]|uniref:Undecaprenyl/decaprenyl-phosphate alpha-N-acetylglucosaminyl 1-phosphate transferase n=1 Tax=Leucobacter insecticola TaxID=2714934 RepID=A0A6G8FKR2_9MICO|nr:MraY family glycosyltransferase [Leucobacter insecticola]QIM17070.1 undecaprenyl/decaprenyl-phosphate alpha-N-acetylglucosaminyl 1-phosphate transferase [Leucobacter insecticola]